MYTLQSTLTYLSSPKSWGKNNSAVKKGFMGDVPSKVKITTRDSFTDANKGSKQGSVSEPA